MTDLVEVIAGPTPVIEIAEHITEVVEVASVVGPRGPTGPGNLVTFETGSEPTLIGVPDGTLWVEYA